MATIINPVDLTAFDELEHTVPEGKRVPWQRRVDVIYKQFPSAKALMDETVPNWRKAFKKDIDLFAWILRDILKAAGATPGRSGPKPNVNRLQATQRLRNIMGDDYATEPFPATFRGLAGKRSLSMLSRKTGLSRSQINRLLKGDCPPTGYEMELIAAGFGLRAGYFAEYRLGVVLNAMAEKLENVPEATVKYWREITLSESAGG